MIASVPVVTPAATGLNAIFNRQLAPRARINPHVMLLTKKSPLVVTVRNRQGRCALICDSYCFGQADGPNLLRTGEDSAESQGTAAEADRPRQNRCANAVELRDGRTAAAIVKEGE